jgi:Transcriptional Coactivator p15 (PC4)
MASEYSLGEWRIRQGLKVRVRLTEYRNRSRVDVRQWYLSDAGQWMPGKTGIGIPVEHLGEVMRMLQRASSLLNGKVAQHTGAGQAAD